MQQYCERFVPSQGSLVLANQHKATVEFFDDDGRKGGETKNAMKKARQINSTKKSLLDLSIIICCLRFLMLFAIRNATILMMY